MEVATVPVAFATPTDLSAYTKGAVATGDPRAQDALDGISASIRKYCGWHIAGELTETVRIDGPGGSLLTLPTLHLVALPTIVENGTTLLDDQDYRWSADGSVRRYSYPSGHAWFGYGGPQWSTEFRSLVVTMTHGFAEVPDLKQIVLQIAARGLSSPTGATREQAGQMSVSWATTAAGVSGGVAILAHEQALVDPYRIENA